jgi:glucosylceramidase
MKNFFYTFYYIFIGFNIVLLSSCLSHEKKGENIDLVNIWLTNTDQSKLFQEQGEKLIFGSHTNVYPTILVNSDQTFQTIDGFGYTLTGGSAMLIQKMEEGKRKKLLKDLFSVSGQGIGVSYLRLSIGASDLDEKVFSYNDLSEEETDIDLTKFSLDPDRAFLIPVLKQILEINPEIKLMGSPWSPPVWMKDNRKSVGGSLLPQYYDAYANYFVMYVLGMQEEGIRIDAITVQNEPLHPGNNPSLLMLAKDQAEFVKSHLGPAFEKAGITTKIIIYDHNADRIDYPLEILDDPEAKKYLDGSAFHLYGGTIDALSDVYNAHPDKNIYFTEQWIGAPGNFAGDFTWHIKNLIIGATRNWSRTVLEWNLAADPEQKPHTEGGCTQCLGAITINGDEYVKNTAFYIIAHASKFVRPGSSRIESSSVEGFNNVAFFTPEGQKVLIVQNESSGIKYFNVNYRGKTFTTSLSEGAVATLVW